MIEQKNDEIADLGRKLSDAEEQKERNRMDRDSLREEVNKLQDQWRSFKEDTSIKYESYNKQLNQQEAMSEEKVKGLQRENEKLREDIEAMKNERQQAAIFQHEQEFKYVPSCIGETSVIFNLSTFYIIYVNQVSSSEYTKFYLFTDYFFKSGPSQRKTHKIFVLTCASNANSGM